LRDHSGRIEYPGGRRVIRASEEQMSFFYIGDAAAVGEDNHGEGVAVLVAGGELDYAASPQLKERLTSQIDAGMRRLVLDLSMATFIDSTAIGVVVGVALQLDELSGGLLAVVCADENKRVLRILEIAGLESLLALHSSREQALLELTAAG
jgi:anti-anti-sigma factor